MSQEFDLGFNPVGFFDIDSKTGSGNRFEHHFQGFKVFGDRRNYEPGDHQRILLSEI